MIAGPSGPATWRHMKYNVTLKVTFEIESEEDSLERDSRGVKELIEQYPPIQACGTVEIESTQRLQLLN